LVPSLPHAGIHSYPAPFANRAWGQNYRGTPLELARLAPSYKSNRSHHPLLTANLLHITIFVNKGGVAAIGVCLTAIIIESNSDPALLFQ
jgi:hypothetical protein